MKIISDIYERRSHQVNNDHICRYYLEHICNDFISNINIEFSSEDTEILKILHNLCDKINIQPSIYFISKNLVLFGECLILHEKNKDKFNLIFVENDSFHVEKNDGENKYYIMINNEFSPVEDHEINHFILKKDYFSHFYSKDFQDKIKNNNGEPLENEYDEIRKERNEDLAENIKKWLEKIFKAELKENKKDTNNFKISY